MKEKARARELAQALVAVATTMGKPTRAVLTAMDEPLGRAVGNALGANPVPIVIPCHRVIQSDQGIGGFSSGLRWKRFLLEHERGQLELGMQAPRRRSQS